MMRVRCARAVLLVIAFTVAIVAKPSPRFASLSSLGLEYQFLSRGQLITEAEVPAEELQHLWTLSYIPMEYLQFSLGGGIERFEVDPYEETAFEGNYGFAPAAGVALFSPAFLTSMLRVTAGYDMVYLNSRDSGYRYSGLVMGVGGGLLLHAGPYVDVGLGARYHVIYGRMGNKEHNPKLLFSNTETLRGYIDVSLISPVGAYAQAKADFSPKVSSDWADGPYEGSVAFAVGLIIRRAPRAKRPTGADKYFPSYRWLQKRQDEMEKQLEE